MNTTPSHRAAYHSAVRRIFLSVGEPSGDLHGSNLIRAIRQRDPSIEFVGFGGPKMGAVGCELLADLTQLAIMWLARALLNLHKFVGLLIQADRYFREHRPDAVVLIDYPGFNWWVARRAKAHGIPVYYYGTPQMWAWASWRVAKMRRLVDHVLCKLPFEVDWYRQRNCHATYVGHPFFDQLATQTLDQAFMDEVSSDPRPLVTILPGSRTQEVVSNLNWLISAATKVSEKVPQVRFAIASYNDKQAVMARELAAKSGLAIEVHAGRTQELIKVANCCMACSGSVSLELLYHTKPTVILYWMKPLFFWFATEVCIQVRFITLVNLLTAAKPFVDPKVRRCEQHGRIDEMLMPEYPTWRDKTTEIASHIIEWLTQPEKRAAAVAGLEKLKREFAHPGASQTAAEYILATLKPSSETIRHAA